MADAHRAKGRASAPRILVPVLDRSGRFSPLKAVTLALIAVPAIMIAATWITVGLGPRPLTEAIHRTGDWTVRLLMVGLTVSPARRILEWPRLILVRRMLGLGALAYILTHFTLYIVDMNLDLGRVAGEIALRIYLTIGFVALLGLCALGVTSTDGWVRRLGPRWVQLHNLIYPIAVLALLHFFMQSKLNVTQPALMTGFFLWLMGYRVMRRLDVPTGALGLTGLAAASGLLTALVEYGWYALMTNAPAARVLMANLDFTYRISPAWYVFASGIAVVIIYLARRLRWPIVAKLGTIARS